MQKIIKIKKKINFFKKPLNHYDRKKDTFSDKDKHKQKRC